MDVSVIKFCYQVDNAFCFALFFKIIYQKCFIVDDVILLKELIEAIFQHVIELGD